MGRSKLIFTCMAILSLSGCGGVIATAPIGEKVSKIKASDWEGTWTVDNGAISIAVVDADQGRLKAAGVELKNQQAVLRVFDVWLRETGDWMFANVKIEGEKENGFWWYRVKREGDWLLLYGPDLEKFKRLINEKKLPGEIRVDGPPPNLIDTVTLKELTSQQQELIASEKEGVLLKWDEPLVLVRLRATIK